MPFGGCDIDLYVNEMRVDTKHTGTQGLEEQGESCLLGGECEYKANRTRRIDYFGATR
ncbi:MAG: hypothetical protein NVS1B6_18620 [Steroidobacteraceae bacterium]